MDIHEHVAVCDHCRALNDKSKAITNSNGNKMTEETGAIADQIVLHYIKSKK